MGLKKRIILCILGVAFALFGLLDGILNRNLSLWGSYVRNEYVSYILDFVFVIIGAILLFYSIKIMKS
jgi:hypothetical protein